jgi:trehalose 6-phosphate phosphatase
MMPSKAGTVRRLPPPPPRLSRPAIFLDLDGVLAPIVATPDAVAPAARRTAVLARLAERLDGRLAILSGRTIAEIDRICDGVVATVSGIHGLERRTGMGPVERAAPARAMGDAHAEMVAFADLRPGVLVENKGLAVGLHYRQAPQHERAALDLGAALADRHGLAAQPGQMVIELKTPGADKGTALDAFMGDAPFAGATPIMVGDDLTDEHAFRAAERRGGFGVLVGPPRDTAAHHGLVDSEAVLDWLDSLEVSP